MGIIKKGIGIISALVLVGCSTTGNKEAVQYTPAKSYGEIMKIDIWIPEDKDEEYLKHPLFGKIGFRHHGLLEDRTVAQYDIRIEEIYGRDRTVLSEVVNYDLDGDGSLTDCFIRDYDFDGKADHVFYFNPGVTQFTYNKDGSLDQQ